MRHETQKHEIDFLWLTDILQVKKKILCALGLGLLAYGLYEMSFVTINY